MANMVFYELENSPFFFRYQSFVFYFTSKFYLDKFEKGFKDYIREETLKLNVKYKMIADADEMLILSYYKTIEKRGFKVKYKGNDLIKDYYIDCMLNKDFSEVAKG